MYKIFVVNNPTTNKEVHSNIRDTTVIASRKLYQNPHIYLVLLIGNFTGINKQINHQAICYNKTKVAGYNIALLVRCHYVLFDGKTHGQTDKGSFTSVKWASISHYSPAYLRQQSVKSHWLSQREGSILTPPPQNQRLLTNR